MNILFLILLLQPQQQNGIEVIKSTLSHIKPYTYNLNISKKVDHYFKNNTDQFHKSITQYIKQYPLNPANYRLIFKDGYRYYLDQDYPNAIKSFEQILGLYNELNDYILFYLGESYEVQQEYLKAYQYYALIPENSIFFERSVIRKVTLLLSLKRYQEIKLYFEQFNYLLENIRLSYLYAQSLIHLNQKKTAILQLKKVWFQAPKTLKSNIEKQLAELVKQGDKSARISRFERFNRCEFLLQNKNYKAIKKQFKLSYTLKNSTDLATDRCFIKAHFYTGHSKKFLKYIYRMGKLKIKRNKMFLYNQSYLTGYALYLNKRYQKSLKIFQKLITKFPSYPENERIFDLILNIHSQNNNEKQWFKTLDQYLKYPHFTTHKKKYLFKGYWLSYQANHYQKTINYSTEYLKLNTEDIRDEMRAQYYRAKSYLKLKLDHQAATLFIMMIQENPFNYYSYLAYNHLKNDLKKLSKQTIIALFKKVKKHSVSLNLNNFYTHQRIRKIYELISLDLRKLAITELINFSKSASENIEFLAIALFFENLELYKNARSIFFKTLRELSFYHSKRSFISFWRPFYPKKYQSLVMKNSKKLKLSPYIIWSVMREESAYNPFALSVSDAYGLLQLLYPTAQETATKIGMTLEKPTDLFKPTINIPLGSKYFAILMRMFKQNPYYSAAAYNGGATNVKKWVKRFRSNGDLYDFCEMIPFEQTNRYIYKVIGSFHTYRLLYEPGYFKIGKLSILNYFFKK